MSKLPVVSGAEMVKFLESLGFKPVRQRGSHLSMFKLENEKPYLVIVHMKKEIKTGTLLSAIRQAGLTREEFMKLWEKR